MAETSLMFLYGILVVLGAHTVAGQGDAWLVNITSSIFGLPWNQAELSVRNSSVFKEEQNFFCGKINEIFQAEPVIGNPVKQRYYRCFIDSFHQSNSHTEAPVSFTYGLVFNGSDPIPKPKVDSLLTGNTETYQFGSKVWTLIGDWLISRLDFQMVRVNLSDYLVADKERIQPASADVETLVDVTADLFNFTMTPGISDPTSSEFSVLSNSVCTDMSKFLSGRFLTYKGCNVTSVVNNSVEGKVVMTVRLKFAWDQEVFFPRMIAAVIVEESPRMAVGNEIVLAIGSVKIPEASVTGRAPDPIDRPDANPCLQKQGNAVLPDPADPSAYVICIKDTYFRYNCRKTQTFDASRKKCVNHV